MTTNPRTDILPAWEAMYEPGNVSDYLIGYANDQDAATGMAEAWLRSQAEVAGRLEWVAEERLATGRYDRWFELIERHTDGVDTGPGIIVRRRMADEAEPGTEASPVSEAETAATLARHCTDLATVVLWCADRVRSVDDDPAVQDAADHLHDLSVRARADMKPITDWSGPDRPFIIRWCAQQIHSMGGDADVERAAEYLDDLATKAADRDDDK